MQSTFEEEKIIKMSKCTFYGRPLAHHDSQHLDFCILIQFLKLCLKKVFAGQCLTAIDVFYTKASDRYLVFAAS